MPNKSAFIVLSLACVIMGFFIATQLKIVWDTEDPLRLRNLDRPRALAAEIETAKKHNERLQREVERLRGDLDEAMAGQRLSSLKNKLDSIRAFAGFTELEGPGVKVTLNDSQESIKPGDDPNLYVLHDEDVIRVLNELKAAGAEAISMNEQRVIFNTEVRCIGPTVLMNKSARLSPPFVIKAIGDKDTLFSALKMKGGVIDSLKWWGIEVKVEKVEKVTVSPFDGGIGFNYAKPAQ